MTRIALVTGSEGLIGGHTTTRLQANGWAVHRVDTRTNPGMDARDFFRNNLTTRYDLVVHCAAQVGGRVGIEHRPAHLAAVNLQLDAALFEWALRTRPAHVVYWSSSAAYPTYLQTGQVQAGYRLSENDIDLTDPENPDNTYGWVKLTGERLAHEAQQEGLNIHVFRPFSGYGPDQSMDYPFPAFVDRARRRADPFDVWGDGEQVRDFIHVDDVVSAALTAVELDYPGPLNLCTGVGTSFNQLAELMCRTTGYQPVTRHHPDKPVGVRYRVGDPTQMLKVWAPRVTLEDGVTRALQGGS